MACSAGLGGHAGKGGLPTERRVQVEFEVTTKCRTTLHRSTYGNDLSNGESGRSRSTRDRDSEERASEGEDDQVLEGLDEMSSGGSSQIREVLKRIENGNYGICSNCGQPISATRLAAVPSTVTCVVCGR